METCQECGKKFGTKQKLASHRYNVHGVRAGGKKLGRPPKTKRKSASLIEVSVTVGGKPMRLEELERLVKEGQTVLKKFRR